MRPSELRVFLSSAIANHLPVLITGSPGIGKSDIVASAAKEAGADLIVSHPVVSDPTDAKGLPWPDKEAESAKFLPFGDLARAVKAVNQTVWFLDDLGQAPPSVQASYMQLLLARRVNDHVLPDCVTFVAATNRRTDRAGVSGMLEPVKSRFASIVPLEVHLDDWCAWAIGANIHTSVIAFLRFRPELLSKFEPSADLTNSPVPRTWAHVSKLLSLSVPDPVIAQSIAGAVGSGAAGEFLSYLKVCQHLPDLDVALAHPEEPSLLKKALWVLPTEPSVLYAFVTGLAMKAASETADAIVTIADRLMKKGRGEFAALLLRDTIRKDRTIAKSRTFIAMANGPLGKLIAGEA
jgi:dynein-related subfamily AAA family protein